MKPALLAFLLLTTFALVPRDAYADDAGIEDAGADASDASEVPLACGGALCDTANDSTCALSRGAPVDVPLGFVGAAVFVLALALVRRRGALGAAVLFVALPATASAEPEPAVNVVVRDPPAPRRIVSVEVNPLSLVTIGKLSANVVLVPIEHHALVLSPFYAWTKTAPIAVFDDAGRATQLPEQKFTGFGGEIGYRYYAGDGGPRGFFVGPSLLLASFEAKAQNGTKTSFADLGVAADAGYQMLVADRVSLGLGAGVQYLWTSKSIPDQQFPARIYANRGFAPRILVSLGWAF